MMVNTRGGVFAQEGYGGGLFNGNVAFGAVEATPVGALGNWSYVPWECWGGAGGLSKNQSFTDCAGQVQSQPEFRGVPLSDPKLAAAIGAKCSGLCNRGEATKVVYPRGTYSTETQKLQNRINSTILANRGEDESYPYCEVAVDGKLGPETCTAWRTIFPGMEAPTCAGLSNDWASRDCSTGDAAPAPGPVAPPPVIEPSGPVTRRSGSSSTAMWVAGGVIAALAIGGVAWYLTSDKQGGSADPWF